ncbi:hypothetical protein D9M71_679080 [compost metagenome]
MSRAKTSNGPIRTRVLSSNSKVTRMPVSKRRIRKLLYSSKRPAMISSLSAYAKCSGLLDWDKCFTLC